MPIGDMCIMKKTYNKKYQFLCCVPTTKHIRTILSVPFQKACVWGNFLLRSAWWLDCTHVPEPGRGKVTGRSVVGLADRYTFRHAAGQSAWLSSTSHRSRGLVRSCVQRIISHLQCNWQYIYKNNNISTIYALSGWPVIGHKMYPNNFTVLYYSTTFWKSILESSFHYIFLITLVTLN